MSKKPVKFKEITQLKDEIVSVYYEYKSYAYHVATFDSEELYIKCLPILKKDAKEHGYDRVTESITDETN